MSKESDLLRQLPAVGQLLQEAEFELLNNRFGRSRVKAGARQILEDLRKRLLSGDIDREETLTTEIEGIADRLESNLADHLAPSLRRLINATGILIHTNLGRAPLGDLTARGMLELATGYSNLEYRLESGERGHRDQHFEERLKRLLPCEAATVCNNNAAAVFLILNTLAEGKEVIVSRGELVEIGGSFRIPAILAKSGARLREVGTTNKTRLADYRNAITDATGLILKVHPSNYRIIGFTAEVDPRQLVELAAAASIPVVHDAGSGSFYPSGHVALRREPAIEASLNLGFDLVCCSGDKVLGGPQAGIIAGRRNLIEKIRKNPLMRVLRVDKMTYAALESTLIELEKGESGEPTPIRMMLETPVHELELRAERLARQLSTLGWQASPIATRALLGGGSAPEESIPSAGLRIRSKSLSPNSLERALRTGSGLISRIEKDEVVLDLRTVLPGQDPLIVEAFRRLPVKSIRSEKDHHVDSQSRPGNSPPDNPQTDP